MLVNDVTVKLYDVENTLFEQDSTTKNPQLKFCKHTVMDSTDKMQRTLK